MDKYIAVLLVVLSANQPISADLSAKNDYYIRENGVYFSDSLAVNYSVLSGVRPAKPKTITVVITAYSSSPEETDGTPFITASGSYTRDGVAASNFLKFGTKFRVPELFGNRVFTIEDRMNQRYDDRIDIWFLEKESAKKFGKQMAKIEIL